MRAEKISILNEVIERVKESEFCFIINYCGLKVDRMTALRKQMHDLETRVMVVKNSYLAKAVESLGWEDVSALLTGQTAVVTGSGDAAGVAKVLVKFIKGGKAEVKGANVDRKILSAEEVVTLSKLPSKDAMRSMLLNTMSAPATSMARVLNAPMLDMLYVLKAYQEKNESAA